MYIMVVDAAGVLMDLIDCGQDVSICQYLKASILFLLTNLHTANIRIYLYQNLYTIRIKYSTTAAKIVVKFWCLFILHQVDARLQRLRQGNNDCNKCMWHFLGPRFFPIWESVTLKLFSHIFPTSVKFDYSCNHNIALN